MTQQVVVDGITIVEVQDRLALYERYANQRGPQGVYIEVDYTSDPLTMRTVVDGEVGSGNCVPEDVYHGRTHRYGIGPLYAASANRLMREIAPRINAIAAEFSLREHHGNYIGVLSDRGVELRWELEEHIEQWIDHDQDCIKSWDAGDWLQNETPETLGITANTTDEELEQIAQTIRDNAPIGECDVIEGLEEYLEHVRDNIDE